MLHLSWIADYLYMLATADDGICCLYLCCPMKLPGSASRSMLLRPYYAVVALPLNFVLA